MTNAWGYGSAQPGRAQQQATRSQSVQQSWGAPQGQSQHNGGWGTTVTSSSQHSQQQYGHSGQSTRAANASSSSPATLSTSGCQHAQIKLLIDGTFAAKSENHGRPVYVRDAQVSGLDVMLYYWDQRDGPANAGWWFGPKVGSEHVWAYNSEPGDGAPPATGWRVPYDGPVDPMFYVQAKPAAQASAPAEKRQRPSWEPAAPDPAGWGQSPSQGSSSSSAAAAGSWEQSSQGAWQQQQQQPQQSQQQEWSQQDSWGLQQPDPNQSWDQSASWDQASQQGSWEQNGSAGAWQQGSDPQGWDAQSWEQEQQTQQQQQQHQAGWGTSQSGNWEQGYQQYGANGHAIAGQIQQQHLQRQLEQKREEERRQREEDMKRRRDEELKRRREEEQQRRKQEQEEARKRLELQRQEMLRKKKEEEERKQREAEELAKKKEEEARQRKLAMEKKAQETKAAVAIRRAIQKLRVATPDNIDTLQNEMEDVSATELEKAGSQSAQLQEESAKALTMARKRVDNILETRKKEEEKKAEQARIKKEKEERIRSLLTELAGLIDTAEAALAKLKEAAATFIDEKEGGEKASLDSTAIEAASEATESAFLEAKTRTKACAEFAAANKELKEPLQAVAPSEAEQALKKELKELLTRVQECNKTVGATVTKAREVREAAAKKASASERTDELKELFKKYDKDDDGMLSRAEIVEFAKSEYHFVLQPAALDAFFRNNVLNGAKGPKFDQFLLTRMTIGVARELARGVKRKADRAKRQAAFEKEKAGLLEKIKKVVDTVSAANDEVSKAESEVPLIKAKGKNKPEVEALAFADEIDQLAQGARVHVQKVKDNFAGLSKELNKDCMEELQELLAQELKKPGIMLGRMDQRINRLQRLGQNFRVEIMRQKFVEIEALHRAACKILHYNRMVKKMDRDNLFDEIDTNKDGEINEEEFVTFFDCADKVIREVEMDIEESGEVVAKEDVTTDKKSADEAKDDKPVKKGESTELSACMAIRRAIQKMRVATAETFDALKKELDEVVEAEMDCTGPQREKMQAEVDKGLELVDKRLTLLAEQKRKQDATKVVTPEKEADETMAPKDESQPSPEEAVELSKEQAAKLFTYLCGDESFLSREAFMRFTRAFMKVVKEAVMTQSKHIKKSKITKRLAAKEVIEILDGPLKDREAGMSRVHARTLKDGTEGWVTIKGNQGTPFLEDIRGVYKVATETALHLAQEPEGAKEVRRLKPGEVIEVYDLPKKDETSGEMRIKGKCRVDGAVGWITTTNKQGAAFAELL